MLYNYCLLCIEFISRNFLGAHEASFSCYFGGNFSTQDPKDNLHDLNHEGQIELPKTAILKFHEFFQFFDVQFNPSQI